MSQDSERSSAGLRFFPFDVETVRVADSPEEIQEFEKLMKTRVKETRFDLSGATEAPHHVGTISGSGGRDDECDQDIVF